MAHQTPFGTLKVQQNMRSDRLDAVLRALRWCDTIVTGSLWIPTATGKQISLRQTINEQTLEIFPLEAAFLDLGRKSAFPKSHLPINLNNSNACVRADQRTRPRPLHTDMIASMILLLGSNDFDPILIPSTLHQILTVKQRAELPPPPSQVPRQGEPALDRRPFTLTDEEAREYILDTPHEQWLHHAKRLTPHQQPSTFRWLLFHFISPQFRPLTAAFTWAIEQFHGQRDLFSHADIERALSHPSMVLRSWAVMNCHPESDNHLMNLLKPMRYDIEPLVTHKVLTRIRSSTLSSEAKIKLIEPLLHSKRHRGVAIIHLGHLSLKPARKLEILAPFLVSSNADEVISSIRGLRDSGCQKTEQVLIQCFGHENRLVLRCLLQSIASFGPWFEHHAQQLSTYPEVNLALLNAMGRTYGFNQVPIINAIMKHERNTIIVRGLAALSKLHSIEAIEIIGGYLLNHDSRYVRRNAAEDLGKTKQLTALKYLEQVDNDISNGVRDSVKRSIERINKAHC